MQTRLQPKDGPAVHHDERLATNVQDAPNARGNERDQPGFLRRYHLGDRIQGDRIGSLPQIELQPGCRHSLAPTHRVRNRRATSFSSFDMSDRRAACLTISSIASR